MLSNARVAATALSIIFLSITAAHGADPQAVCESQKLKSVGRHDSCLRKEAGKAVLGKKSDPAKCEEKFSTALDKADAKAEAKNSDCRYLLCPDGRTVEDLHTGLMWQRGDNDGGITDQNQPNTHWEYTATPLGTAADGNLFTVFLAGLNDCKTVDDGATVTGGFAGYCDWRIPQIGELLDIRIPGCVDALGDPQDPCIDQAAFGPTLAGSRLWSLTEGTTIQNATHVDLTGGIPGDHTKSNDTQARAVRCGSCAPCATPPADRIAFASSAQQAGDFGGVAGADGICQGLAESAGLATPADGPVFLAWLSDDIGSSPAGRFNKCGRFVNTNSDVVAEDWDDLTDGMLANPILFDEFGTMVVGFSAWTGTDPDGSASGPNCDGWTTTVGVGQTGSPSSTLAIWSNNGAPLCNSPSAFLYCFEQ